MKKQIAVDELTSGITGQKIETHDVITSPNQPDISLLADNDLITKQNLSEAIPDPSGSVTGMAEAGDPNPIVVPFTFGTEPKVAITYKISDTERYTPAQVWKLTFTDDTMTTLESVSIYGNDAGDGTLNEDTYYSIQG